MTGQEILNDLGNRGYQEPLLGVRYLPTWPSLDKPLHLALLVIDFDTELAMNGILGFLENPTGAFLDQTIDAFATLGADQTAAVLRRIRKTTIKHAVSHHRLRAPYQRTSEYQITTFAELHGRSLDDFAAEVCDIADELYIHDRTQPSPFPLLEAYVEQHATEMLSEIERAGA